MAQITGGTGMVDKMIGTAFQAVKEVRDNLDKISYLVTNMTSIQTVAANLIMNKTMIGKTALAGQTVNVVLDSSITQSTIVAQSVMIVADSGAIYGAESGYFTAWILSNELYLKLSESAPTALTNATVKWCVFYEA